MRGDGRIFQRGSSRWIAYCHRGKEIRESVDKYFRERGDKSKEITDKHAERLLKLRRGEIGADSLGAKVFIGPQQERVLVCELLDALETDLTLRQARSLPALEVASEENSGLLRRPPRR